MAQKYKVQGTKTENLYRLTLSSEAFALSLSRSKVVAGYAAWARCDGKWDVFVSLATANQLKQMAAPGENLSDVVMKILERPTDGQEGST